VILARDPKQCRGSKKIMYYNDSDDVDVADDDDGDVDDDDDGDYDDDFDDERKMMRGR
jgi:hypothetical protein